MLRIIILNYKRPENVKQIVLSLQPIFPKITIINNNPEHKLPYWGGDIDVINNERNYYCMERWVRCFEYEEPYKLIIDAFDQLLVLTRLNLPLNFYLVLCIMF